MPGQPTYKALEVYQLSRKLVIACYDLITEIPSEEKTNLTAYLKDAALTVHLNVAKGAFLKKKKQKKICLRQARLSLIVIDTILGVLIETGLIKEDRTIEATTLSSACDQLLGEMKKS
jgi:four helix bundle protein